MRRWSGRFLGLALLLAVVSPARAEAPKEAPGQAKVLHVTYYFLPG